MKIKLSLLIIASVFFLSACSKENSSEALNSAKQADVEQTETKSTESLSNKTSSMAKKPSITYKENVHYKVVKNIDIADVNPPMLVEYFWLGCPHCYNFEAILAHLHSELPELKVLKKPAAFNDRWALDAKVFHALKEMEQLQHLSALFELYHSNNNALSKEALNNFLLANQIDSDTFFELLKNSDVINQRIVQSINEMHENEIKGVPAVVVNGKYLILASDDIRSADDYLALVRYLLEK
ncbi:DsbA family protein [Rheinheimera sp. WS51]|uniref:DsbA family protein n=1 Tax=Rheinheimera sp. WS51 TaxID=3425886 RepID=UPI003D9168DA